MINKKREEYERLVLIVVFLIFFLILIKYIELTGFSIYNQTDQSEFDLGMYVNTSYNGSAVVLVGGNLSGSYMSKVFDAGEDVTWSSLDYVLSAPTVSFLYGVDGGGDVYRSVDGLNWNLTKTNFGRTSDTIEMFSDAAYFYILSNSNKEVWRSSDGVSWVVINHSFANSGVLTGEADESNNLVVVDASGDVYSSDDLGMSWELRGDFNGAATNAAKGMGIDSLNNLYIFDGSKSVYFSLDQGQNWSQKTNNYDGTTSADDLEVDLSNNLYILDNKDVWKSTNSGENWTKINDSFTSYTNDGCKFLITDENEFYIADCVGRIFRSTDSGVSWQEQGDMNSGATNNPKGLVETSYGTNISFLVRNCSQADCSDGVWQTVNLDAFNFVSRYFQYKVEFSSADSSITPLLSSVTLNYDVRCVTNLMNTSWSEWMNKTTCQSSGTISQERMLVQYDTDACGEVSNQTFYEYQLISCNYISSTTNTSLTTVTNSTADISTNKPVPTTVVSETNKVAEVPQETDNSLDIVPSLNEAGDIQTNLTINEAEAAFNNMKEAGFNTQEVETLLLEAKSKPENSKESQTIINKIINIKEKAFYSYDLIIRVLEALKSPRNDYLLIEDRNGTINVEDIKPFNELTGRIVFGSNEAEEMINSAMTSFEAGSYDLATEQAETARSLLMQKREKNPLLFIYLYWYYFLIGLILLVVGIYFINRKTRFYSLDKIYKQKKK